MPEISRFLGIIIAMFGEDYNPPHSHVRYGDYEAIITIKEGVGKVNFPVKSLRQSLHGWINTNLS